MSRGEKLCHGCFGSWCAGKLLRKDAGALGACQLGLTNRCPWDTGCSLQQRDLGGGGRGGALFLLSWVNVKSLPLQWPVGEPEVPLKAFL